MKFGEAVIASKAGTARVSAVRMDLSPYLPETALKKQCKWLLALLALLATLGFACFALLRLEPIRFTADMADRIHPGMTEAEVVAILGRPAGDYASEDAYFAASDDYRSNVWAIPRGMQRPDGVTEKAWVSDVGGVVVEFDSEDRVRDSYWEEIWTGQPKSPLDMLRRGLRRLFR